MNEFVAVMWKPLFACFILTGIHAYFGMHVIERKVIFVDLALAQIAALGATFAFVFGFSLHGNATYVFSLAATAVGAAFFAFTRSRKETVPHEAVIGIIYAAAAAASVLILSHAAEGDEHIRYMLIGNILLVDRFEIIKMLILYTTIGALHFMFRRQLFLISSSPEKAAAEGLRLRLWDFFFYLTFGFVVTSSVQTGGVLLVFSYLIIPSVAGAMFFRTFRSRLLFGWFLGILASIGGLVLSYALDLPTGATIVCFFAVLLFFLSLLPRR